jgi:TPR repeat protein
MNEIVEDECFESLQQQAMAGIAVAMNQTAIHLILGLDEVEKNYETAVDWIKKAAALQNVTALHNLSCIYRHGILGYEKNKMKADYWMSRALSIENLSFTDGLAFMKQKKYSEAISSFEYGIKWFLCTSSLQYLSSLYKRGEHVPMNIDKALEYMEIAAKMGSLTAVVAMVGEWQLVVGKEDTCGGCGKWAVNVCSGCKTQKYCSLSCQAEAWASHKPECCASIYKMD